jgi:hypothetical protein
MFEQKVLPPTYVVVKENDMLIGIMGFQKAIFDPSIYSLCWVHIHNAYQGK